QVVGREARRLWGRENAGGALAGAPVNVFAVAAVLELLAAAARARIVARDLLAGHVWRLRLGRLDQGSRARAAQQLPENAGVESARADMMGEATSGESRHDNGTARPSCVPPQGHHDAGSRAGPPCH